jgi:hypothetical protein
MGVKSRIAVERTIVSMIVTDAIEQGCKIAIHYDDGEASPVLGDYAEIMREVMAADEEILRFYKEGDYVGSVFLVYGNDGWDAICDHSANYITTQILTRAEAFALSQCE